MDRRRLIIPAHGDKFDPADAIFRGVCTARTVNAYWGASAGTDCIHYKRNADGTYTYYMINGNKAKQWWDRFFWYNSDDVVDFHVSPDAQIWETNNNRFNSKVITAYDFGKLAIKTKSLRESFYNCLKLKSLDISNWDLENCTSLYAMLAMDIGGEDTEANKTALTAVAMPDTMETSKCTEAHKMFAWNRRLSKITGMRTVNFRAVTNFSEMFCENRELSSVDFKIDNWVSAKCTDLHSMFLQCFNLDLSTLGDFTTWDVSSVKDFSNLFARTATTSISIEGWNMSSATNVWGMFQNKAVRTDNLTLINLKGITLDPSKLASHEAMFAGCGSLKTVILTSVNETDSPGLVDFIKSQLLADIPDRVTAEDFSLVLDDGSYRYADGQWTLQS